MTAGTSAGAKLTIHKLDLIVGTFNPAQLRQDQTACCNGPTGAPLEAWCLCPSGFSSLLHFSLRSGAVVILTSAARSGGEVRITEAERPPLVSPGRRAIRPESRRIAPLAAMLHYTGNMRLVLWQTGGSQAEA